MTSQGSPHVSGAASPTCLSSTVPCWGSFQSSGGIRLVSSSFSEENVIQHHVIRCYNSLTSPKSPDSYGTKLDKSSRNSCQQYNDVCCRLQDDGCVLLDVQCHPRNESCYSPESDNLGCSSDDSCPVPVISCRPPDDNSCPVPVVSCRPPDDSCMKPSIRSYEKEDDVLNVIMDWQFS